MQQLPKFDPEFAKKQEDADNAREVSNFQDILFFVKASKRILHLLVTTLSMHESFRFNLQLALLKF
jgi:hypothetical protein